MSAFDYVLSGFLFGFLIRTIYDYRLSYFLCRACGMPVRVAAWRTFKSFFLPGGRVLIGDYMMKQRRAKEPSCLN